MGNASKALIMAGGILIGIMLATFMVMMLRKGGSLNAEYDLQITHNELVKFNSQFEIYDKDNNTIFDVITVANHAYDVNQKNGFDPQNSIEVSIRINKGGQKGIYSIRPDSNLKKGYFFKEGGEDTYIYDLIEDYSDRRNEDGQLQYQFVFDCTNIEYNEVTGKVARMTFVVVQQWIEPS